MEPCELATPTEQLVNLEQFWESKETSLKDGRPVVQVCVFAVEEQDADHNLVHFDSQDGCHYNGDSK